MLAMGRHDFNILENKATVKKKTKAETRCVGDGTSRDLEGFWKVE
jgi:hypothetical protein